MFMLFSEQNSSSRTSLPPAFALHTLKKLVQAEGVQRLLALAVLSVGIPALAHMSQALATAVLYGISMALACTLPRVPATAMFLSVAHGITHHVWPFIGAEGLAPEHSVFADQVLHFLLGAWAHHVALKATSNAHAKIRLFLHVFGGILLAGNMISVVLSAYLPADDAVFVESALFSALNSGYYATAALAMGTDASRWQLPAHLSLWTSVCYGFYVFFRMYGETLSFMFIHRFFESFFMIPVWVSVGFAYYHRLHGSSAHIKQH